MKTKWVILVLLLSFIVSVCAPPRYVPKPSQIGLNYRGAYIIIQRSKSDGRTVNGELIAVEPKEIIVLTGNEPNRRVVAISIDHVKKYKLKYAASTKFDWAIPVFSLFTISHGWYLFLTMPINIATTSLIAGSSRFNYREKDLPIDRLHMFARFPQGIPDGVDVNSLQ